MESYCGKNCDQCAYRSQGSCPGCKDGPGMPYTRTCPLARCCQQKGHQKCDTCLFRENCRLLRQKDSWWPLRAAGPASRRKAPSPPVPPLAQEQARLLLRGMTGLLLLEFLSLGWGFLAPSILSRSLSHTMMVLLVTLSAFLSCAIYFWLNRVYSGYYIAGFGRLYLLPVALVAIYLRRLTSGHTTLAVLLLIYMLLFCLAEWAVYLLHGKVAAGVHPALSKRWRFLSWLLPVIVFFSVLSYLDWLTDPQKKMSMVLLTLLAVGVVKALKLVFLCQTVNALKQYLSSLKKDCRTTW